MLKKLLMLLTLIIILSFGISVCAKDDLPKIVINNTLIKDTDEFILYNDTLYTSPSKLSDMFNLSFSCDENGIIYTFSNKSRSVTYDTMSGSLNIGDKSSFAYTVTDSVYPSYELDLLHYVPIRMICNSFNLNVDYLSTSDTVVISYPDYSVGLFNNDGLAIACKGGKYGIVDLSGQVKLDFKYDDISNHDNLSMFKVILNHRCGIAGKQGTLVTDIIYNEIEYVSESEIYIHLNDEVGMCNIYGNIIIPVIYDDIIYSENNYAMVKQGSKWALLNFATGILSDTQYDEVYEITQGFQTDNHMIKGYYAKKNNKWGCVDSFGNTVIEFIYDALDKFDEKGRARIIYKNHMGIIDCGGKIIIPTAYDYIHPFGTLNVAVAQIGEKYGAINIDSSVAIPFEYDYIYSFNNNNSTVAYKDGVFVLLSLDGTLVTDKTYRYIEEFKNGIALAYSEGYGYIDHSGNEIIDCVHTEVKQGTSLSVFLKKDDKWALFNSNGDNLTGYIYNSVSGFENGLSAVSVSADNKEKYGFVNDSGDVIIPFIYSSAQKFKYGKSIVSIGSNYGIIDVEGNTVIPFNYTGFNPSYDYNVIAAANKNSKWGLITFANSTLTSFAYDYIFDFQNGYAAVLRDYNYGVIDTKGRIVIEVKYTSVQKALEALNMLNLN